MAKEMDCSFYFPGNITKIDVEYINIMLSRYHDGDNQRRTDNYYIYADDNLLGGK